MLRNSASLSDADYLKKQESGLKWLLKKYLDNKTSSSASSFKTLPEGDEIIETYENANTRAALLHKPEDELNEERFYVIAEAK